MYQSRSSIHGYNRTVEIEVSAARLNSNDIFILVKGMICLRRMKLAQIGILYAWELTYYIPFSDSTVWMWRGSAANDREVISAEESIDVIADGSVKVKIIKEGSETDDFW